MQARKPGAKASASDSIVAVEMTDKTGLSRLLFNLCWLLLGGLQMATAWAIIGIFLCLTICGIPFGVQCLKISYLVLWPFGQKVHFQKATGEMETGMNKIMNCLWIGPGVILAILFVIVALVNFATIVFIPFGIQYLKFARISLSPFGLTFDAVEAHSGLITQSNLASAGYGTGGDMESGNSKFSGISNTNYEARGAGNISNGNSATNNVSASAGPPTISAVAANNDLFGPLGGNFQKPSVATAVSPVNLQNPLDTDI